VPKQTNIYDLVERALARGIDIPRLELWQKVSRALLSGELPAANLADRIHPTAAATTFFDWLGGSPASLGGFRASVDRFNDPNVGARILKRIMVRDSDFGKWFRRTASARRGPRRGFGRDIRTLKQ
jgi:hypothetical protein